MLEPSSAGVSLSPQSKWSEAGWIIERIKPGFCLEYNDDEQQEEAAKLIRKVSINWVADFDENQLMEH